MANTSSKRAQQAQETRTRLIEAGTALIQEKGYQSTTVSDICAACGVAKGTFYHYFRTKFDLLGAATTAHMDQLRARAKGDICVCQDVLNIVTSYIDLIERRGIHTGRALGREMLDRGEAGTPLEFKGRLARMIGELLEDAAAKGLLIPQVPIDTLTSLIDLYLQGLLIEWTAQADGFSLMDRCMSTAPILVNNLIRPYIAVREP